MKYFTIPKLCRSATARKYKINNECSLNHIQKHLIGEAADITTGSIAGKKQLFELVKSLNLPFD